MGKFTVTLHALQEGVLTPGPSIEYNFNSSTLSTHISNIANIFQEKGFKLDTLESYCLQTKKGHIIDTKNNIQAQLSECDTSSIDFLVHPSIRVERAIELVTGEGIQLKENVFSLRSQLIVSGQ